MHIKLRTAFWGLLFFCLHAQATEIVDLDSRQCRLAVADLETGFVPAIEFNETPLAMGGKFLPGVILTSLTDNGLGLITSVRLQMFKDEIEHSHLDAVVTLTYDNLNPSAIVIKEAHFRIELSKTKQFIDYKEQLSFEARDRHSGHLLNVPGQNRHDGVLRLVHQSVSQRGLHLSFDRTTPTKIRLFLDCELAN